MRMIITWLDASLQNMTRQLDLSIRAKLSYAAKNFVMHQGAKEIIEECTKAFGIESYPILSVLGEPRSGKTHLSIFFYEQLAQSGKHVQLFDGSEFVEKGASLLLSENTDSKYYIVDNADDYLLTCYPETSGTLVSIVERLRKIGGYLIFFRSQDIASYPFDEHLGSRFQAGREFQIGDPAREEIGKLLEALMLQRGLKLPDRKLNFLTKRLPATLPQLEEYVERMADLAKARGEKINFPILNDSL